MPPQAPPPASGSTAPPEASSAPPEPAGPSVPRGAEVRCKLHRADGSEWTVTSLVVDRAGPRVDAYRYVRVGHRLDTSERETLENAPLEPGDRVECLNRRGAVIWRLGPPA